MGLNDPARPDDPADGPAVVRSGALAAVAAERRAQDERWGAQDHPDLPAFLAGVSPETAAHVLGVPGADRARARCERDFASGDGSWAAILLEELCEALADAAAGDPATLRAELVQVAAVAVAWAEALDRRAAT